MKQLHLSAKYSALDSGALLFASSLIVNIANYGFNLIAGRLLTPSVFGEVSVLITLLLGLSFVATAFQLTSARYPFMYFFLEKAAWKSGMLVMIVFVIGAHWIANSLAMPDGWPVVFIGAAIPVYFTMSVGRGYFQGSLLFRPLVLTYQAEVWVRFGLGITLLLMGLSTLGVSLGLLVSLVVCYGINIRKIPTQRHTTHLHPDDKKRALHFFMATLTYELSQILINNSDVILVKHYFSAHEAGLYAALALIGRVVYFGTWSVVMVLFPKVVQRRKIGLPTHHLFLNSLLIVTALCGGVVLTCLLLPDLIVNLLFGSQYSAVGPYIWQYALATAFFALTNVFVYYYLSLDRRTPALIAVSGGLLQIALLLRWHTTFSQVIWCQITAMFVMLLVMLVYHFFTEGFAREVTSQNVGGTSLQCLP